MQLIGHKHHYPKLPSVCNILLDLFNGEKVYEYEGVVLSRERGLPVDVGFSNQRANLFIGIYDHHGSKPFTGMMGRVLPKHAFIIM